jgi:hypothetical protein
MAISRAFLLLAGFASENYLKGLWVARNSVRGRALTDRDPFIPKALGHHVLLRLADEAGVPLNVPQRSTLELLERSVVWQARYPFPKNPDRFQLFGAADAKGVRSLVNHLKRQAFVVVKREAASAQVRASRWGNSG